MMRAVIGIDPGLDGAIAVVDHLGSVTVEDMPTVDVGDGFVKRKVDAGELFSRLRAIESEHPGDVLVVVEYTQAMPLNGGSSTFSLGVTTGTIDGVIACARLPHVVVKPQTWKKAFALRRDKDESREVATRIYPAAADRLKRKKDHNRAEALLLARYGWQHHA